MSARPSETLDGRMILLVMEALRAGVPPTDLIDHITTMVGTIAASPRLKPYLVPGKSALADLAFEKTSS